MKVVVNTGAEVTVLSKEVYNRLREKFLVMRPVTMMQAADGAHQKGFFDVKAGHSTHQVDLCVASLKDSMLLGMYFLRDHKAN